METASDIEVLPDEEMMIDIFNRIKIVGEELTLSLINRILKESELEGVFSSVNIIDKLRANILVLADKSGKAWAIPNPNSRLKNLGACFTYDIKKVSNSNQVSQLVYPAIGITVDGKFSMTSLGKIE